MKKTLNHFLLAIIATFIIQLSYGQADPKTKPGKTFRIAFYNVENLFDTIDDPRIDDNEFLPGARIPWTTERYENKLDKLAEVIHALSVPGAFAVMGLCEVENKTVLDELVKSPRILPYRYEVIHRNSPDERGIDNAMLYDAEQFQPVQVISIKVDFPFQPNDRTRDILYVKGVSKKVKTDTLHLFVNHWPSRYGGREASDPKRVRAAEILKSVTDSLLNRNPLSLIVVMGDLNDEPSDKSLAEGLKALPVSNKPENNGLYNLMYPLYKQGKGTLYYQDWDMFDQIIISGYFWNKTKGISFSGKEGKVFEADWLLFTNDKGVTRPNRTAAKEYYGGYSDHLPVYIDLMLKK